MDFGYRAKYIQQSAKVILEKGKDWLVGLRDVGYEDAHKGDSFSTPSPLAVPRGTSEQRSAF